MPIPKNKQKQSRKPANNKKKNTKPQQPKANKPKTESNKPKNESQQQEPNNNIEVTKTDDQKENQNGIRGINLIPINDYCKTGQTFPPSKKISELYEVFPLGETAPHPYDGKLRMESDERKAIENNIIWENRIKSTREAAEVHRQVRQATQNFIKPGKTMVEICQFIESSTNRLVGYNPEDPISRGWGFPTGCSLNHCAAHYTPNPGDTTKLKKDDLCKIDFGVQINGNIIDCAFSMSFDPKHDTLMEAVKAATNQGVKVMGIDARLGEVGASIQEVMESYECTYNNKTHKVKCIQNLNGHSIGPWIIHGGKTVPIIKTDDQTKVEEGELYAIETFGSTGKGWVYDDGECSHFGRIPEAPKINMDHKGARDLLKFINKRFGTIPFCRRWLEDEGQTRHIMALKHLVNSDIVRPYPPLCDQEGCYTAQYEHTILMKPTSKEILSRGLDF